VHKEAKTRVNLLPTVRSERLQRRDEAPEAETDNLAIEKGPASGLVFDLENSVLLPLTPNCGI